MGAELKGAAKPAGTQTDMKEGRQEKRAAGSGALAATCCCCCCFPAAISDIMSQFCWLWEEALPWPWGRLSPAAAAAAASAEWL